MALNRERILYIQLLTKTMLNSLVFEVEKRALYRKTWESMTNSAITFAFEYGLSIRSDIGKTKILLLKSVIK